MPQRKPLTDLQNGCFARQKVQRTYGKKGKASTALVSKDFFTMAREIEVGVSRLGLSDDRDQDDKENKGSVKPVEETVERVEPTRTSTPDHQAIKAFLKTYSSRPVLSFRAYGKTIDEKCKVKKIGEGTFSSVFALTWKADTGSHNSGSQTSIIKLMPILLPSQVWSEGMTELSELENEVRTLKLMDPIHGFTHYRDVMIVKGSWPDNFLKAFRHYKATHKVNGQAEDPEELFDRTQHYALIEMGDAGKELCKIDRPSIFQIYDIFWSTCIHLAYAEAQIHFEHRDMHVSNICIKPADPAIDRIDVARETVTDMKERPDTILGMTSIAITIIDCTYSRLTLPPEDDPNRGYIFRPIEAEYKYEELRDRIAKKEIPMKTLKEFEEAMQDLTYAKAGKCIEDNHMIAIYEGQQYHPVTGATLQDCEHHVPKTNVCWLGYLITCLLRRAGKTENTKYVAGSNTIAKEVQEDIRNKLIMLRDCVSEGNIKRMPKSAEDVVRIGLENGWLGMAELEAFKARLQEDSEQK